MKDEKKEKRKDTVKKNIEVLDLHNLPFPYHTGLVKPSLNNKTTHSKHKHSGAGIKQKQNRKTEKGHTKTGQGMNFGQCHYRDENQKIRI